MRTGCLLNHVILKWRNRIKMLTTNPKGGKSMPLVRTLIARLLNVSWKDVINVINGRMEVVRVHKVLFPL